MGELVIKKIFTILMLLMFPCAMASVHLGISYDEVFNEDVSTIVQKFPNIDDGNNKIMYLQNYRPIYMLSSSEIYYVEQNKTVYNSNFVYDDDDREDVMWQAAIEQNPNRAEYFYGYAAYLNSKHDFKNALNKLDHAIELDSNYALAHFLKGDIYRNLGRYRDSVKEYLLTVYINPYCEDAYFNIAKTLENFGYIELALDFYGYAYLVNSNDIEVRNIILKLRQSVASK